MATVTDQLITVLKLVGAKEYAHGMGQAANAAKKFGQFQKASAAGGGGAGGIGGGGALAAIGGVQGLLKAATVGSLVVLAKQAVDAFSNTEQAVFRTQVVLKNLGSSLPIEQVQGFAKGLQQATGISDEAAISTVGLLKRFGAADNQVESLTKTVADFAAGTGISMEQAGTAVGHAVIGNTRMLRNMGIEFKSTGDRAKDLIAIQQKLNDLFGGAAEARRNTVAGSFEALKNSFQDLLSTLGSKLATIVVPVVNAITAVVSFFANNIILFTTAVGALAGLILGGPVGALIGAFAGLGVGLLPNKSNAAEGIGNGKSKLATEDTLNKIEKNTSKLNESLISQVLGGPGTVANMAGNWRDAALGFRA